MRDKKMNKVPIYWQFLYHFQKSKHTMTNNNAYTVKLTQTKSSTRNLFVEKKKIKIQLYLI